MTGLILDGGWSGSGKTTELGGVFSEWTVDEAVETVKTTLLTKTVWECVYREPRAACGAVGRVDLRMAIWRKPQRFKVHYGWRQLLGAPDTCSTLEVVLSAFDFGTMSHLVTQLALSWSCGPGRPCVYDTLVLAS